MSMSKYWIAAGAVLLIPSMVLVGQGSGTGVKFTDITTPAGIKFVHNSGRAGKKFLPETLGAGAAFFDYDGDGWPDLLLINSKDWTPRGKRSVSALYHNNKNGTFTDVTAGSGLLTPLLSALNVTLFLAAAYVVLSMAFTGAVRGWPVPSGMPVWLACVGVFIAYNFTAMPLRMARRATYDAVSGPAQASLAAVDAVAGVEDVVADHVLLEMLEGLADLVGGRRVGLVVDRRAVGAVEVARERDAVALPERADQGQRLLQALQALGAVGPVDAGRGDLVHRLARADAEEDAAGCEARERREALRDRRRVVPERRRDHARPDRRMAGALGEDRKSTRLNSSH